MVFFFKKCRIEITPDAKGFAFEVFNSNQIQIASGFDLLATKPEEVFPRARRIIEADLQRPSNFVDLAGTTGKDRVSQKVRTSSRKKRRPSWYYEEGF
jgi:hypothetical protein